MARRGFTLTEISVVVGVIGFLLGAIWIAAAQVYSNYQTQDLLHEILVIQQNARAMYSRQFITDATGASGTAGFASDEALTDSCSGGTPCSTNVLMKAGVFLPDFISPTTLVSGVPYTGGGTLRETKFGFPIWTGVENSSLYAQQKGTCGQGGVSPPCPSGFTVIEVDLLSLSPRVCTNLLMTLVDAQIEGMSGISTNENGWGPEIDPYFGNPTIPSKMPLSTASAACGAGSGPFAYSTSTNPELWMWFSTN